MADHAGIKAALEGVVSTLTGADPSIRAGLDAAALQPPCAWVSVDTIVPELLNGDGSVVVAINCIVGNVAVLDAYELLDQLLGQVLDLVPVEGDVLPESVVMPDNPQTLPSYRVLTRAYYTRTETP